MYNLFMAANVNPIVFIKEARTELAKVIWPTRSEALRLTLVVIGVSVGSGLFIGGLDIAFVKITELLLKK